MLPDNVLSTTGVPGDFLAPDNVPRDSLLVDREMGGTALSNPNDGLMVQVWRAWLDGNDVRCATEASALVGGLGVILFSEAGITELSLSFDQSMRPVIAYVSGGVCKLRWYDSLTGTQATTSFGAAASPFVSLDDKRPRQLGGSDVLLFYLRDGKMWMRRQRDRYESEFEMCAVAGGARILRAGMNNALRMQFELGEATVSTEQAYTAAYSDLVTDTLYGVGLSDVLPFYVSDHLSGRWRSRLEISQNSRGFGWLRVNGEMDGDVVVRVFGDGVQVHEITTAVRTPERMPAGRWRRMEIEVESTVRCTGVTIAGSAQELRSV